MPLFNFWTKKVKSYDDDAASTLPKIIVDPAAKLSRSRWHSRDNHQDLNPILVHAIGPPQCSRAFGTRFVTLFGLPTFVLFVLAIFALIYYSATSRFGEASESGAKTSNWLVFMFVAIIVWTTVYVFDRLMEMWRDIQNPCER